MNDNEYNQSFDEQATRDPDSATIEPGYQYAGAAKAKDNKKQRMAKELIKKGNAMLASTVVAAAIIVGTTISGLASADYTCGLCGKLNCKFWSPEYGAQANVFVADDRSYTNGVKTNWNQMGYFSSENKESMPGIRMGDGRLATVSHNMHLPEFGSYYYTFSDTDYYSETGTSGVFITECIARYEDHVYGSFNTVEHDKASVVQLIYAPNAELPEEYYRYPSGNFDESDQFDLTYCETMKVAGADDLYLRAYTNVSRIAAKTLLKNQNVEIHPVGGSYKLGNMLTFIEDDDVRLSGEVEGTHLSHLGHEMGYEYEYAIHGNSYVINSGMGRAEIIVQEATFEDVLKNANEMETEAPTKGHDVFARMRKLNSYKRNGIVYDAYLIQSTMYQYASYDLIFVPRSDPNVGIKIYGTNYSYEAIDTDIDSIKTWQQIAGESEVLIVLNRICLRGGKIESDAPYIPDYPEGPGYIDSSNGQKQPVSELFKSFGLNGVYHTYPLEYFSITDPDESGNWWQPQPMDMNLHSLNNDGKYFITISRAFINLGTEDNPILGDTVEMSIDMQKDDLTDPETGYPLTVEVAPGVLLGTDINFVFNTYGSPNEVRYIFKDGSNESGYKYGYLYEDSDYRYLMEFDVWEDNLIDAIHIHQTAK